MKFLCAILFFALLGAHASAQTCPQFPSLISTPCTVAANGSYRLAGSIDGASVPPDVNGYSHVIKIASGVTQAEIDCYGYRIEHNGAAWSALGVGIGGKLNSNITIKNCRFEGNGMGLCVYIDNSANWDYQRITLQSNACSSTWMGFYVYSHRFKAFDNYLAEIGGNTNCYPPSPQRTYGINWVGAHAEIERNKIRRLWSRCYTEVVGVSALQDAPNLRVCDNDIENDGASYSYSIGVWFGPGSDGTYCGNRVSGWHHGFLAGYPAQAPSALSGTALITNVVFPVSGFDAPPVGNWTVTP